MDDEGIEFIKSGVPTQLLTARQAKELRAENEMLRAAIRCVVAAMDENGIAVLHRPNACDVEADSLRQLLSK
jgi:hypothetical protein